MTNTTITLKAYELSVWNNGGTWARARIAYRHNAMYMLSQDELAELIATLADANFEAEMSDDYSVTRREKAENNAIVAAAEALLN